MTPSEKLAETADQLLKVMPEDCMFCSNEFLESRKFGHDSNCKMGKLELALLEFHNTVGSKP